MKKTLMVVIAALVLAVTTPAWGQSNTNPDQLDCWELIGWGGYSFGTETPIFGVDVLRYSRNGSGLFLQTTGYKATPGWGVDLGVGYSFGEHAFIRGTFLGGLGPVQHLAKISNEVFKKEMNLHQLRPEVGLQITGGYSFGGFEVCASVAYRLPIGLRKTVFADGASIDEEIFITPGLTAGLGLGWKICKTSRYDGDRCTQVFASFGMGKTPYASLSAEWLMPWGWSWFLHFGGEYQYGLTDQLSKCLVFAGVQYRVEDKWHDDSWLLITFDPIRIGVGEGSVSTTTYTKLQNGDWYKSRIGNTQSGLAVAGYLGIEILPAKCFDWKTRYQFAIRFGYEVCKTFLPGVEVDGPQTYDVVKSDPICRGLKIGAGMTF